MRVSDALILRAYDKELVLHGKINDAVINCSQTILHQQFPQMTGFFSTLWLKRMEPIGKWQENFL